MSINPGDLPVNLQYIIPIAEKHGYKAPIAYFDHSRGRHVWYAENLAQEELYEITNLYVHRQEHKGTNIIDTFMLGSTQYNIFFWGGSNNCLTSPTFCAKKNYLIIDRKSFACRYDIYL